MACASFIYLCALFCWQAPPIRIFIIPLNIYYSIANIRPARPQARSRNLCIFLCWLFLLINKTHKTLPRCRNFCFDRRLFQSESSRFHIIVLCSQLTLKIKKPPLQVCGSCPVQHGLVVPAPMRNIYMHWGQAFVMMDFQGMLNLQGSSRFQLWQSGRESCQGYYWSWVTAKVCLLLWRYP